MSKILRTITSSNWKPVSAIAMLTLLVLIGVADLIVLNNKMQASGMAQDRVNQVREGNDLKSVVSIEDISNINSPEFPKGFQIKIKNISSKPIYHIYIAALLPETEPLRTGGPIWFELQFGHPKLVQNSIRLEDITESERKEHPLTPLEPGKSLSMEIDDETAEQVRKHIETEFGNNNPVTKRLELTCQVINFGDGTGYLVGQPYPNGIIPNGKIGLVSPKEQKIPAPNAPSPKGLIAFSLTSFLLTPFLPGSGASF
jgi:hypothetical protein